MEVSTVPFAITKTKISISIKYLAIIFLLAFIAINFLANIYNVMYYPFDDDEFQHFHITWNVFNGKIIYKDFFEHHGPIFPFINSAVISILQLKADVNTILFFRYFVLLYSALILILTYKIGKEISDSSLAGIISAAILSGLVFFQSTTSQIRPDGLQNVFWLTGLLFILKNLDNKYFSFSLFGGIFLSLSVLSNPKGLIGPASVFSYYLFRYLIGKKNSSSDETQKQILKNFMFFSAGFVIPYLVISAYFLFNNALSSFLFFNYGFNFNAVLNYHSNNFKDSLKFLIKHETIFILFSAAGLLYLFLGFVTKKITNNKFLFLLIITGVSSSSAVLGLYKDLYLVFLPLLSIVISVFLIKNRNYFIKRHLFFKSVFFAAVVLLFIQLADTKYKNTEFHPNDEINQQKEFVNFMLENTNRNEPILFIWCEWGGYVFNEDLQFFWFENENFRSYYKKLSGYDIYGENLINKLEQKTVRYIIGEENRISLVLSEKAYKYFLENFKKHEEYHYLWVRI